jgi:signal peptidase I
LPNLQNGEYILVNKVDYMLHSPQRGDVIVFNATPAGDPDKDFIKRVIGLPGDTVEVRSGIGASDPSRGRLGRSDKVAS